MDAMTRESEIVNREIPPWALGWGRNADGGDEARGEERR